MNPVLRKLKMAAEIIAAQEMNSELSGYQTYPEQQKFKENVNKILNKLNGLNYRE